MFSPMKNKTSFSHLVILVSFRVVLCQPTSPHHDGLTPRRIYGAVNVAGHIAIDPIGEGKEYEEYLSGVAG
jgi:hypothetical protein